MFDGIGGAQRSVALTLYTDAFVIRGEVDSRQRRVTDILSLGDERFLVLSDVTFDEFGPGGQTVRADFAQVNLASVLFAVADQPAEASPELRTPKTPEQALISVPPFKVIGNIHLMPGRGLRESLSELTGRFIPVTDALYWSDALGEPRTTAALVAVNHDRAQLMAPHREVDPWAGVPDGTDRAADAATAEPAPSAEKTGWD